MAGQTIEALALLRAQRHSFLNHLQVISGFLQLGKPERALDYLKEVQLELENWGRIMRLKVPEVAFVSLCKLEKARMQEIATNIDTSTNLAGFNLEEDVACRITDAAWEAALSLAGYGGTLKVSLKPSPEGYCWTFKVSPLKDEGACWASHIYSLEEMLAGTPGKYSWEPDAGELKVWLG
ncbi:MAG: hypothetical protein PWP65_850 [Clostridia bacterium]|nr:hypothetical protein [Clostridia bacterium]